MTGKNKLIAVVACASLALCGIGGCGTPASSGNNTLPGYVPYDDALRVEDVRALSDNDYSVFNTVGTDDFGRTFVTMDGAEDNTYVGMFYFLCNGQNKESTGVYDVSRITENGANQAAFQVNDSSSPLGAAHWWGEPVFGYYNSEDPWVLRKHIELLTMAGIDFLVFDVSNAFTYKNVTDILFPIMQEYYDAGWNVPKFMYYTAYDTGSGQNKNTITELYENYYKDGKFSDLWFCPYEDGKPVITRHANTVFAENDPIGNFFHFRLRQWPTEAYNEYGTPWIEFSYPQPVHTGWMNVAIATHAITVRMSQIGSNPGRGATWYGEDANAYFINDSENYRMGAHFEQQWDHLISKKDEVQFAFVTGWNEWCATKMVDSSTGEYFTVDTYNAEFSRDIEPTRTDGMGDNFYLQTVRKIRDYRAAEPKHYLCPETEISAEKDDEAWENVQTYLDFTNECADRNFKIGVYGNPRQRLTNTTGRNDLESVKVARDGNFLYFRVTATEDITARGENDPNWMNIWIRTQNGAGDMLNGYNYVINRAGSGAETVVLRTESANKMTECGKGEVRVFGKAMIVKIPLSALGLSASDYTFTFKVTDNVDFTEDYMNLYDTGDCAPCGRLNFSYGY